MERTWMTDCPIGPFTLPRTADNVISISAVGGYSIQLLPMHEHKLLEMHTDCQKSALAYSSWRGHFLNN